MRDFRFRLGISQEELADRADLHRTYIASVEGGSRNITLKSIEKLARALEVSIPELLASSGQPASRRPAPLGKVVDILLVEDNPDDVALTFEAFRAARIANPVHVVGDGAEALHFLRAEGPYANRRAEKLPRVILLDLHLPRVDGLEVLRLIKSEPRTQHIPVVVLTVSHKSADIAASRRLGAATYIVKPIDFQNFSRVTPELSLSWALVDPEGRAAS